MRTGLIAKKLGMSRTFDESGVSVPVTLLQVEACQVTAVKTEEKDGYNAVQLGAFSRKAKNVNKPQIGHFAKAKVEPKAKLVEFRVSKDALLDTGFELSAYHFVAGQKVDVRATTIGKGFQGGMKRWNFGGLEASHGISISHRSLGSTGQCQDPGKVFKGKKMAGQMGNTNITMQNLKVVSVDEDQGLVVVKGSVPGSKGTFVTITDAIKAELPDTAPFPAARLGSKKAAAAAEAAEKEAAETALAEKAARDAQLAENANLASAKEEKANVESEAKSNDTASDENKE